jgi:hypothetical protein
LEEFVVSNFEFGVGLFPTEPLPKMVQLAKVTEELGYSHIWVGDSHLIWREAYVNMAAMALNTIRVKLGTGVTNPLTRHPSVVASAYATLEEYALGRTIVGIGLGDSSVETMGMKPAKLSYFEKNYGPDAPTVGRPRSSTGDRQDPSIASLQKQSAYLRCRQRAENAGTLRPHRRRDNRFSRRG